MKTICFRKTFFIIFLLFFLSPQSHTADKHDKAEKHYHQAVTFYENGKRDSAISHLKKSISLNRKHAKAYNQLALIYMDEGTVHGRFKATFEMERALKLEPDNLQFRYNYALLNLKKGLTFEAKRQFSKILEADPYHAMCYFHLASLEEENAMHYKNMISIDPTMDGIIFMQSFAKEAQQKAANYYKQAISANPKFSDVYYRLALLLFEFNEFNEMIQLLESAVKIMPKDKNCRLFLGFAYQQIQRFDDAEREYNIAKSLMRPAEVRIIESIKPILSSAALQEMNESFIKIDSAAVLERIWKSKDPFYLTEFNERKLEHFSRMAYANLRFSFPEKDIEGWQTDRGKVFIRYGNPKYKYRTHPYIGTYVSGTRNPLHHSKEYWIYDDFHFIFEDQYLSGNYSFAWEDGNQPDFKYVYEEMIEDIPDFYRVFPDSHMFQVPLEMAAFKGSEGKTELEISYAIPSEYINFAQKNYELNQGLFFFDDSWDAVLKYTGKLKLDNHNIIEANDRRYGMSGFQARLNPGNYHFALEFMDQNSKKCASIHKEVVVDTFFADQFQMSDVLLAHSLEPPESNRLTTRADFRIIPNPMRTYEAKKPIPIYFEIYNLSPNASGASRYTIEYKVGLDGDAVPAWQKFLTSLKLMKKEGQVTSRYEYSGESEKEIQFQNLSLPAELAGEVKLIIQVTDLISMKRIQKQERFIVTETAR